MEENRPIRRRWVQFSLRTFLIVTMLVGFGGAWVGMQLQQKRRHESAVNEIVQLGGAIYVLDRKHVPAWKEWLFGSYAVQPIHLDLLNSYVPDSVLAKTQGMNFSYLALNGTNVADAKLAHLEGMTSLKELFFYNTPITDAGLSHLKDLAGLKRLSLVNTQITDAGLKHLPAMKSLEVLSLGKNRQITDAGLTHLKEMTRLRLLFLKNSRITDAGLTHLTGLTRLEELHLHESQVTQAGIDELQQAIPGCEILNPPPRKPGRRFTCILL